MEYPKILLQIFNTGKSNSPCYIPCVFSFTLLCQEQSLLCHSLSSPKFVSCFIFYLKSDITTITNVISTSPKYLPSIYCNARNFFKQYIM